MNNKPPHNLIGAEIICIGSELLLGNITNTNARWLAEELAFLGIPHFRQTVIGDNTVRLKEIIFEASRRSRILITTGGLGPTPDDITTESIASIFNTPLQEQKYLSLEIKKKTNSNASISKESIQKQASIPIGAQVIPNPIGIAPGIIWSPTPGFSIMTFPGVPSELKAMWRQSAVNWLKQNEISKEVITSKVLRFTGINESNLAESIPHLLQKKNPTVAPYAELGEVKLRITAKGRNTKETQKLIKPIEQELKTTMGVKFYTSENKNLATVVLEILRKRNESLAIAESCTGGGIGAALTNIPGSSDVFFGGIIAYNNLIKTKMLDVPEELIKKYGAVSSQIVEAMAKGVQQKFQTNWAIAVSGIAGPSGDGHEKKIGLVHFCAVSPSRMESGYETFGSFKGRTAIQKLSVLKALDRLRLMLLTES